MAAGGASARLPRTAWPCLPNCFDPLPARWFICLHAAVVKEAPGADITGEGAPTRGWSQSAPGLEGGGALFGGLSAVTSCLQTGVRREAALQNDTCFDDAAAEMAVITCTAPHCLQVPRRQGSCCSSGRGSIQRAPVRGRLRQAQLSRPGHAERFQGAAKMHIVP